MMERDVSDKWIESIGRYITTFAYVERLVYGLFDLLPADKLSAHGRGSKNYSDRVRFMQALLRSVSWPRVGELDAQLENTLEFSQLRNHIAHNPVFIEIWTNEAQDEVRVKPVITHAEKGHNLEHITLDMLQKKIDQLHTTSSKIAEIVFEIKHDEA